jgi:hypothetical protein
MFESKKTNLFPVNKKTTSVPENKFVQAGLKKSAETLSGNMAKKYRTTGNALTDQFGTLGEYKKPRCFADIVKDCELAWTEDPAMATKFIFYLRTVVRKVKLFNGTVTKEPQKGAQLKHEAIMRMFWLYNKSPNTFWNNLGLFVSLGSWKDIFVMLQYDLVFHGWEGKILNWSKMGNFILSSLENSNTCELIKKYLPQLRANSKCTTVEAVADNMIAKWICCLLYGGVSPEMKQHASTYKKYRQLKASGTAHEWQKLISRKQFDRIDFDKIHGRALNLMVKSKFLDNQKLKDKYTRYVADPEKKKIKYTGFVHELMEICAKESCISKVPIHEQETVNKQFATLVVKGGQSEQSKFIVVRDTSASMSKNCTGTKMNCYNIAKSLALYFSEFLTGEFKNAWIEFNDDAKMHKWKGNTPCEKWFNDQSSFIGSTNFQSVINLFVKLKKKGIDEADFPTGILCISDGEFNPSGELEKTNVEVALGKLKDAGFSNEYASNFAIILWNLQSKFYGDGTGKKFETFGDVENVYYFSGFEPSVITFLTSKIRNAYELFMEAMSQEILDMIEIS